MSSASSERAQIYIRTCGFIREIVTELSSFTCCAEGAAGYYEGTRVAATVICLRQLGLKGDAYRMSTEHAKFMRYITDDMLCDLARDQSEEFCDELSSRFGPFPRPVSDIGLDAEMQQDRKLAIAATALKLIDAWNDIRQYLDCQLASPETLDAIKVPTEGHPTTTPLPDPGEAEGDQNIACGQGKTSWQDVSKKLLEWQSKGKRFTSQEELAKAIRCSSATVNKAIDRTPELKEWSEKTPSSSTGMASFNETLDEKTAQSRFPDPSEHLADDDVDKAMSYLISQAKSNELEKILAMDPASQRELAEIAYRDPDKADQVFRYSKKHRKSK